MKLPNAGRSTVDFKELNPGPPGPCKPGPMTYTANSSSHDDPPFDDFQVKGSGEECPTSGYWVRVGSGGNDRRFLNAGDEFPDFDGKPAKWQGAYSS
ncbi:hypothetical protein Prum_090380 [Phytohabitans rumicis]|uniref:Uncharacterized protein n=1 Tax=Phytohabitans rumicis TaxID=1076125 RepID=A0A6V8LMK0_9ACTN|nr:hypothetical protein Prum_090380 [Phytohabitans rumicis]